MTTALVLYDAAFAAVQRRALFFSAIVKDEDLDHNSDLERLLEVLPEDIQRRERYARAKVQIREAAPRAAS